MDIKEGKFFPFL